MDDNQIQDLLRKATVPAEPARKGAARPVSLIAAFLTVMAVATILSMGPWYATSFSSMQLIRMALMESRFNAYVAIVFWLVFRPSPPNFIARMVPIACGVSAMVLEWGVEENPLALWLLSYRLAIVWLVFELVRRGFRLVLQSASEPQFEASGLNLVTIFCIMVVFALLLMADIQIRKMTIGRGQGMGDFPPLLAMASGCSRSFLWIGLALLFAQGDRRYKMAGGASLCLWAITRASIVVYLHWFLRSGISRQQVPEAEQLSILFVMQTFQFGFVLSTCALILWTGYRIRIGSKAIVPETSHVGSFDSIQ